MESIMMLLSMLSRCRSRRGPPLHLRAANLRPETDALAALAACFPGGSITGAPKKRAMEIIRELEQAPRGVYCGAIGGLGYNGESSLSIAIERWQASGK
jgi:para-aminobenzoate synthetase component 1